MNPQKTECCEKCINTSQYLMPCGVENGCIIWTCNHCCHQIKQEIEVKDGIEKEWNDIDQPPKSETGWEEEFDRNFTDLVWICGLDDYCYHHREQIKSFIRTQIALAKEEEVREVIAELETNPNPDGSISPNIQHWIEMKQTQLRNKYLPPNPKEK